MSARHQELIFNIAGQTLYFDAPEGRASGTPTVQVFQSVQADDGPQETATTGSCSVDSVNTTLSSSASPGAESVSVTSATGITRGRIYLLTDTDGDCERVEVMSVSGSTVNLRTPLINSYAVASTFQGCRISIAVDPTWIATKNRISDVLGGNWHTNVDDTATWPSGSAGYRARWSYTVNGTATVGVSYADITRYSSKHLVSGLDVDQRFPGWLDRLTHNDRIDQGAGFIEEAFRQVKFDCLADNQVVRRIRNTEILADLVIHKANVLQVEAAYWAGTVEKNTYRDALTLAEDRYAQRYNQLVREPKFQTDNDGSGTGQSPHKLAAFLR